ncbi:protein kinase domain-containing protein [Coleofasciculus sp.]|uniref:protein kinase domain-containing protein n=1 Tax=Coleofasciculus sp. TaxID=3100458 RepID=UPI0039F87369
MSYCINLTCQSPQNHNGTRVCQSCGAKLQLGDRYRPIRQIGQGGFGRTFLAVDEYKPSKPYCVIKQVFPQVQGSQNRQKVTELFEQEAVRLDELGKHPQIPELLAHFEAEGCQYLVQEFIPGQTLAEKLAQAGSFGEAQIIDLLQDLLPVLQFIHNQQVIHRDVKPENIIQRLPSSSSQLTQIPTTAAAPKLVLVDFGASKFSPRTALSVTGTIIGSAGYTAPEQAAGKAVFASDIYSLGVTCIHLLTQTDPFELYSFDDGVWIWRDVLKTPISERLGRILDKMLHGATKQRYQSATEVLQDLEAMTNPSSLSLSKTASFLPIRTEIIVAKLGDADYRRIRDAIKQAEPQTRIVVRPGFYRESLVIDKDVEIVGEGQPEDIIIESRYQPCLQIQTEQAVIRGLTLRHQDWFNLQQANGMGRLVSEPLLKPYGIDIPQGQCILEGCTILSNGIACIYIHGAIANPQIRHCQIQGGAMYGILVSQKGQGLIEHCTLSDHHTGVYILKGSHPTLRHCKISRMQQDGVFIGSDCKVILAACDIAGNGGVGVTIQKEGNAKIWQCQINRNQAQGIYVESNGAGPIEACDLSGNRGGAWYIASQCSVNRNGNRE